MLFVMGWRLTRRGTDIFGGGTKSPSRSAASFRGKPSRDRHGTDLGKAVKPPGQDIVQIRKTGKCGKPSCHRRGVSRMINVHAREGFQ